MKKLLTILLIALAMSGCGNQQNDDSEIDDCIIITSNHSSSTTDQIMNAYITGYMASCIYVSEHSTFDKGFTEQLFFHQMSIDSTKYRELIEPKSTY